MNGLASRLFALLLLGACLLDCKPRIHADVQAKVDATPGPIVFEVLANGALLVDGARFDEHDAGRWQIPPGRAVEVRAPGDARMGAVVHALDIAKQRGAQQDMTLATLARRARPLALPRAVSDESGQMGLLFPMAPDASSVRPILHTVTVDRTGRMLLLDGAPLSDDAAAKARIRALPDIQGAALVVHVDVAAPFERVLDVVILVQDSGAQVALGVSPEIAR